MSMLNMKHILFFLISILSTVIAVELKTEFEWKYIDYMWDSPQEKQLAIDNGDYNASSCIIYDVDEDKHGRTFVTVIREKGVPANVMTVTNQKEDGGLLLRPYPDWSWYRNKNLNLKTSKNSKSCEGITSVYRVSIKCNHLFILDCGNIGDDHVCPPQLLIFSLLDDTLVKRILIPHEYAANKYGMTILTTPVVSISDCSNFLNNMVVYMSDTLGSGLVIYNAKSSKFCRIESDFMKPTDIAFTINNQSFLLSDGILGLTLVERDLYYATLSGKKMYKIDTAKIQECSLSQDEIDETIQLVAMLPGQTAPIASQKCAIFFSNIPETSILCADTSKKIDSRNMNVIVQDSNKLQFPSGMKILERTRRKYIFFHKVDNVLKIATNKYQRYKTGTLNLNEINFRILSINILEIQKETHCFDSCK